MDTNITSNSSPDTPTAWIIDGSADAEKSATIARDDASGGFQALESDDRVLLTAMHHLGLPLTTFGVCLCLLMLALMMLFTPDRFPVRIGDQTIALASLTQERDSLHAQESALLDQRRTIDQLVPTPVLHSVREQVKDFPEIGSALAAIDAAHQSFILSNTDPLHITDMHFDATANQLSLSGRMIDPTRSITMLASFVDVLRQSGVFAKVSEPQYTVEKDEAGALFSPFTLTLTLVHAS